MSGGVSIGGMVGYGEVWGGMGGYGFMDLWLYVYLDIWIYGYMDIRIYGYCILYYCILYYCIFVLYVHCILYSTIYFPASLPAFTPFLCRLGGGVVETT